MWHTPKNRRTEKLSKAWHFPLEEFNIRRVDLYDVQFVAPAVSGALGISCQWDDEGHPP